MVVVVVAAVVVVESEGCVCCVIKEDEDWEETMAETELASVNSVLSFIGVLFKEVVFVLLHSSSVGILVGGVELVGETDIGSAAVGGVGAAIGIAVEIEGGGDNASDTVPGIIGSWKAGIESCWEDLSLSCLLSTRLCSDKTEADAVMAGIGAFVGAVVVVIRGGRGGKEEAVLI